jgi:hypothetical protein
LVADRKKRLIKMKKEDKVDPSPFAGAKKKYAGHFLLDNLLDNVIEKLETNDKELEKEALLFTPSAGNKKLK